MKFVSACLQGASSNLRVQAAIAFSAVHCTHHIAVAQLLLLHSSSPVTISHGPAVIHASCLILMIEDCSALHIVVSVFDLPRSVICWMHSSVSRLALAGLQLRALQLCQQLFQRDCVQCLHLLRAQANLDLLAVCPLELVQHPAFTPESLLSKV